MEQLKIPAVFMRGGTSKGVIFHRHDLPRDVAEWDTLFMRIMGTPDPNGRQLDGMGGGISSTSKICIVAPPTRPDADVDYTFVQIAVHYPVVDYAGNCGNMSAAIGPFALDEGLVGKPPSGDTAIRIHNTNTGKIIVSRFSCINGQSPVNGNTVVDGVSGAGAPIRLEFTDPGGAKTGQLLPTGYAKEKLHTGASWIEASLIDAANPCVFVAASTLGCKGDEAPSVIDNNQQLMRALEHTRQCACVSMGIAPTTKDAAAIASIPKVALISPPTRQQTLSGRWLETQEMDVSVRMISMGQAHRAVPLTGALCLAAACRIPGSLPADIQTSLGTNKVRIGHASGVTTVEAVLGKSTGVTPSIEYVAVDRTARRLFEGYVRCPAL